MRTIKMEKKKIFIVEDSPTQAEKLKYLLESNDYDVLLARNGMEALAFLETNKPDLIISDIIMPEMNGFELCQKIKSTDNRSHIPVILLTSLSNSEDVIEGLLCGADHFLTKPYNESYLLNIISQVRENVKTDPAKGPIEGVEIIIKGKKRIINVDYKQIITLLISTYEAAVSKNTELMKFQEELKVLNENLEAIVQERTSELVKEINIRRIAQEELNFKNQEIEAQNEEYQQLNEELMVAKEKAEESDRLKSAFLTNMSHEIRTPMNGILGFTSLLKEPDLSSEDKSEFIDIIEKSGDRMLNTINAIIDISKIESGQVKLFISDTDIHEQIKNIFQFFKLEAEQKGLNIHLKNKGIQNKIIIKTDQDKLFSIMSNLLKNALKYSFIGTIEFGYDIKQYHQKDYLEFFVKDEGIGIPKNRQKAIFDRFVQADIDDRFALEGNGLGLAISKAYVEMLGGKIWVESKPDKGSTFYFTIPFDMDSKEKLISKTVENMEKPEKIEKKLKILIAEDEEYSSMHLSIILKNMAKEIFRASSGLEAVDIYRNNPDIDLILMDIKMPVMNGYKATKIIREINKDVVIIAQTAFALPGDKEKALNAEFTDYVSKPINKEELIEKINYFFNKKSADA